MASMWTCALNSGSNGNCIYVEKGKTRLLFDAGISGEQALRRLDAFRRDIRETTAVILSHDHTDHTSGAGIFQLKFGLPIYATEPTFRAIEPEIGKISDVRFFRAGERIRFDDLEVETIPTPHDGVDGVMFVVTDREKRIGIFTDLGHPFQALTCALAEIDFLYLESNYDPDMLEDGGYPDYVKARIRGRGGHLSNEEAALLVKQCCSPRLRTLVLSHLSENNNRADLALRALRRTLQRPLAVHVASRYEATGMFSLG